MCGDIPLVTQPTKLLLVETPEEKKNGDLELSSSSDTKTRITRLKVTGTTPVSR